MSPSQERGAGRGGMHMECRDYAAERGSGGEQPPHSMAGSTEHPSEAFQLPGCPQRLRKSSFRYPFCKETAPSGTRSPSAPALMGHTVPTPPAQGRRAGIVPTPEETQGWSGTPPYPGKHLGGVALQDESPGLDSLGILPLAVGGCGIGTYHLEVPVELGVLPHVSQEAGGSSGGLLVVRAGKGTGSNEVLGTLSMGGCPSAQGDHLRGAWRDWGLSAGGERQEVNGWIPQ